MFVNKKYLGIILFIVLLSCVLYVFVHAKETINTEENYQDSKQAIAPSQKIPEIQESILNPPEESLLRGEKPQEFGKHEIEAYSTFLFSAKAKDGNSRISILESNFDYSYECKLFGELPVTFSLESEYIDINKTSQLDLPSHLVGLSAGINAVFPFFNVDKTYINLGVSPSFYSDDWHFETSSFRLPVNGYLIYRPDEKLIVVAGIAFFPDFKDKFFPVIGFVYKPNEKTIFNFTSENPSIAYSPNDRITIFAEAELPLGAEFEVDHDGMQNVVLIYNDMRLGGGVKYKINKFISASISAGGVLDRYIRYRDIDGKLSIKNGMYAEFAIDMQI